MICPACSTELTPRAGFCAGCGRRVADPFVGAMVNGRYRIDARIAIGGFGAIYRATQVANGRAVAIKIMHRELAADQQLVARFRREGAALCRLCDAHTVTTYEVDETRDGDPYIVMELLDGRNLLELFHATGPLPWPRVVAIARAVCSALAEAHALGIVHRDLKPANIYLEARAGGGESVKVLDFGIAKIMKGSGIDDGSDLTAMGQAVGTLEYMAPEQLMGGRCDGRTDIYTLGVVAYEMITGRRPFDRAGFDLLAVQLTERAPPPSAFAAVPAEVDRALVRCLAHDPADRFADVAALAGALAEAATLAPAPRAPSPEPVPLAEARSFARQFAPAPPPRPGVPTVPDPPPVQPPPAHPEPRSRQPLVAIAICVAIGVAAGVATAYLI